MDIDHYQGYPRGWFCVGLSDEYAVADARPLKYFGQDLVAWRGQDEVLRIQDAFCPHLGAHLGHGGTVHDNTIRCPFHAWRFDASGQCVDVPYATKIPPRACVASWTVREINGMAFVWHDAEGGAPDYEIPAIPEYAAGEFLPWDHKLLLIRTHPKEIVENVADRGHFMPVHGTDISDFENIYDGHRATQLTKGVAYPIGGGSDAFELDATYHGPGYQLTVMEGVFKSFLFNAHTPIDHGTLHLRFGVSLRILPEMRERMAGFSKKYVENLTVGFEQDIAIWENKVYRARPTLCDGDGPIGKLRRWYRQFYQPRSRHAEVA